MTKRVKKPQEEPDLMAGSFDSVEPEDGKVWVRHRSTGDLGHIVEKGGRRYVRMDRSGMNLREYRPLDWVVEEQRRPMTRYQLAAVSFEADRALCRSLGLRVGSGMWESMSAETRMQWRDHGPGAASGTSNVRQTLWKSIMSGMRLFTR